MKSKRQTGVDFVGLAGEVFAQGLEGVDPFLQLHALRNDVPLWVLLVAPVSLSRNVLLSIS